MELLDSVFVCGLVGLASATVVTYRAGNEPRDIRLLVGLTTLWGAGTAAVLAWA